MWLLRYSCGGSRACSRTNMTRPDRTYETITAVWCGLLFVMEDELLCDEEASSDNMTHSGVFTKCISQSQREP